MGRFWQGVSAFFAPLTCFNCGDEIHQGLFCRHCISHFAFIDLEGRCFRCFSKLHGDVCGACKQYPLIHRQAALFDKEFVLEQVIDKGDEYTSLIASLFSFRLEELSWPIFDFVDGERLMYSTAKEIAKRYKKKLFNRKVHDQKCKILYLSSGLEATYFPFSVTTGKIFHLSFFFPTN